MKFFAVVLVLLSMSAYAQEKPLEKIEQLIKKDNDQERLNVTKYNPIYYLHGDPTTKLQISFMYKIFHSFPVYFGYTQLMFWNLRDDSKPFKDINYNPEIFQRLTLKTKYLESIDFTPYEHISNGRDGNSSRSMNRAYVRFNMLMPFSEGEIKLAARVFAHYALSQDNGDIYQYVGPLDLKFAVTQFIPWVFDKGELYVRIFPGGSYAERWDMGGQELGLSFRLGGAGLKPSIYFQYYNGYAESLLEYKKLNSQFRFGVML